MRRVRYALLLAGVLIGVMSAPEASSAAVRSSHAPVAATDATAARRASSPPVLAYYYIWFDPASWSRAKTDRPKLGPYSSDDAAVMRQQVRWAKQAGIEGFLVSWKHTPTLDRRLTQLIDIADQEHFGLGIVYQGLDFKRQALPADRVATDLDYFAATFAGRAPFAIFPRPLIVWSGTWKFTPEEIARVAAPRRAALTILASEKNIAGYVHIAGSVDGNAYYWSSVNPATFHGYIEKMTDMGREVHARNGLWIAPAAPGFDARAIGGTSQVVRSGDATLVHEIDAALASSPDALGIISWNEFTENSHVEPSVRYGWTALNAVGVRLGRGPVGPVRDHGTGRPTFTGAPARVKASNATGGLGAAASGATGSGPGLWIITGFALLFLVLVAVMARRGYRSPRLRVVALAEGRGGGVPSAHPSTAKRSDSADNSRMPLRQAPRLEPRRGAQVSARQARRHRAPWYRLVLNELPAHRRSRRS